MCLRLSLSLLGKAKMSGQNRGQFSPLENSGTIHIETLLSGDMDEERYEGAGQPGSVDVHLV